MNVPTEEQGVQGSAKIEVQCLPSLCRGLYHRVAQKVGCDPSYVSRVARGERTSQAVSDALREEIRMAWVRASEYANGGKIAPTSHEVKAGNGDAPKISKRKVKAASAA